jgi:hypothetical protein
MVISLIRLTACDSILLDDGYSNDGLDHKAQHDDCESTP